MLKQQINNNIKDTSIFIEIRGVEFQWKFSMSSLYDLLTEFEYENELNLMNKLAEGNIVTVLQVFYTGIIWESYADKTSFRDFLIFCDYINVIEEIKEFLEKNIEKYLYPQKKK